MCSLPDSLAEPVERLGVRPEVAARAAELLGQLAAEAPKVPEEAAVVARCALVIADRCLLHEGIGRGLRLIDYAADVAFHRFVTGLQRFLKTVRLSPPVRAEIAEIVNSYAISLPVFAKF